jgi:hypothetical protein
MDKSTLMGAAHETFAGTRFLNPHYDPLRASGAKGW